MFLKIIEVIKSYAESKGIPINFFNDIILIILIIGITLSIFNYIWRFIKWFYTWKNQRKLNKNLTPYFSENDVQKATKNYIKTKYQNIAPSEDEEPGMQYIASAKEKLIPLFIKKVFKQNLDVNKYYLLLADTGMGKTTFMINLFLKYKNQIKWPWSIKYNIVLFPLGAPDIIEKIKSIKKKNLTILLLDAFDEDVLATEDYKNRISTILYNTSDFSEIIITCRTQFFPTKEEEPKESGYMTYGDADSQKKIQKLYISAFSEKDIKKYLKKKYNILNPFKTKKYFKAKRLVKKSPNLMMRPMLLAHIDDLILNHKNYKFTYQIYETLIEKWIEREASKPGIRQKYGSKKKYRELLYDFSMNLSVNLFDNRDKRGAYCITKNEIEDNNFFTKSGPNNSILSDIEIKSKSLLNRNAKGEYKFSHKSILEYFLAVNAYHNSEFHNRFKFAGMDAAKKFFKEKCFNEYLFPRIKNISGEFHIGSSKNRPLTSFTIDNFSNIRFLKIHEIKDLNLSFLNCFEKINIIIIYDYSKYPILYFLYSVFFTINYQLIKEQKKYSEIKRRKNYDKNTKRSMNNSIQIKKRNLNNWFQELKELNCVDLSYHIKNKIRNKEYYFYDMIQEESSLFYSSNYYVIDYNKIQKLEILLSDFVANQRLTDYITELTDANNFISKMNILKTEFEDVELLY